MNTVEKDNRILQLDFIRGIAIILVFIGHAATNSFIYRPVFYEILVQAIYIFHMGLFFVISGFLDSKKNDFISWFFQLVSMMILVSVFKVTNYTIFFLSNCIIGLLCIPFSKVVRKFKVPQKLFLGM